MDDKIGNGGGGLGFLDILSLILVTLKLLGEISCGWWLAFLPWALKYILGVIALLIGLWWKK